MVHAMDPNSRTDYLQAQPAVLADALWVDTKFIRNGLRDLIVAPEGSRLDDDIDPVEEEAAWPATNDLGPTVGGLSVNKPLLPGAKLG
jgi:hypothetical protein